MEPTKKIGILTFHTADNYGAVLQAYALETYIKLNVSNEVEIINFCTKQHAKAFKIFKPKSKNLLKNIILQLITCCRYTSLKEKKNKFALFREKYLNLSKKKYHTENELLNHIKHYDIYISGSDQVFNPFIEFWKVYYLGFSKEKGEKKIAYAPSFGISSFNENITNKIFSYINDFDYVSCRESQGAQYLSKLLKKPIPVVLDPVFLINKQQWQNIIAEPYEQNNYIFVYDLCGGEKLLALAQSIKQETGYKIICATNNIKTIYSNCLSKYNVGPRELLGYINNAKYVVTDSFHGTALSLILKTKVISYIALKHTSSRITSIMNQLNISDQIIDDINNFDLKAIRFGDYSVQLNKLIVTSQNYLQKALK